MNRSEALSHNSSALPDRSEATLRSEAELKRTWEERRGDFDGDAKVPRSKPKRIAWMVGGFIALGLGLAGVALPILPGWVFALVAAFFFAHSSPKFYNWVLSNKFMGPVVFQFREQRSLPARVKYGALAVLVIGVTISSIFLLSHIAARIAFIVFGLVGVIWLIRTPTTPRDAD